MSSATEELRRLLDERGVEWTSGCIGVSRDKYTNFSPDAGITMGVWEGGNGKLGIDAHTNYILTPEQAITAMLGADAKPTQDESSGTCHNKGSLLYFVCSGCGASPLVIRPHYCPNCGRKVVNE